MRRSKLILNVQLLEVLALHGPLAATHIMYKVNVCYRFLKQYLDFLVQQDLVEVQNLSEKRVVYAITERGLTVLKNFRKLIDSLPIVEEPSKIQPLPY